MDIIFPRRWARLTSLTGHGLSFGCLAALSTDGRTLSSLGAPFYKQLRGRKSGLTTILGEEIVGKDLDSDATTELRGTSMTRTAGRDSAVAISGDGLTALVRRRREPDGAARTSST